MSEEPSKERDDEKRDESVEGVKPEGAAPVEAEAAEIDAHSPEAVARRLDALGGEDASEKAAREEEEKLAERVANSKAGKRKKGLEAAASKRLANIGTKSQARRAAVAAVDADPLMDRSLEIKKWAERNQKTVAILVGAVVLGLAGVAGWSWRAQKREEAASLALAAAITDERGRIGDPDKEKNDDDDTKIKDPRPLFKTIADRQTAALDKFREVESHYPGTGAAILARLAEGSLLLDKHDPAGAIAAFTEVNASPLAKVDVEVRGRAWEGIGFAYELKADATPAEAQADWDQALKAFKELENNVDVIGFHELGMYHQARILELKGDKDKEKELLKALHERLNKPGESSHAFPYLQEVADDRLRALDPSAIPAKPAGMMGAGADGPHLTHEQIERMIEQMKKGGGAPAAPGEK